MSRLTVRSGARELLIVVLGNAAGGAAMLAGLKLLTHYLTPGAYGLYILAFTAIGFSSQMIFGPLGSSALRMVAEAAQKGEKAQCKRAVTELLTMAVVGFLGFGTVVAIGFSLALHNYFGLIEAGAVAAALYGITTVLEACYSAERKRVVVACSFGGGAVLRNACAIVAAVGGSPEAAMAGYAAGGLLHALGLVAVFRTSGDPMESDSCTQKGAYAWRKRLVSYGTPFMVWAVPMAVYLAADKWILGILKSREAVAIYSVALQVVQLPTNFAFSGLLLFASPHIFGMAASDSLRGLSGSTLRAVRRATWGLTGAGIVGGFVVVGFGRLGLRIFASAAYERAFPLLLPIFIGTFAYQIGQWEALAQLSAGESSRLVVPKTVTASLGIVLILLGAWRFGPIGVAWGIAVVGLSYSIWIRHDANSMTRGTE